MVVHTAKCYLVPTSAHLPSYLSANSYSDIYRAFDIAKVDGKLYDHVTL